MKKLSHSMHAASMSLKICVTVCSMLTGYTSVFGFSADSCTVCHPLLDSNEKIAQYFQNYPFAVLVIILLLYYPFAHPSTVMSQT